VEIEDRVEIGIYNDENEEDKFLDLMNEMASKGASVYRITEEEYNTLSGEEDNDIVFNVEDDNYRMSYAKLVILNFYKELKINPTIKELEEKTKWLTEE
jgi:hypothetical protein